ncbi:MAG: DUF58 domain-containing protein [Lewinellaceae bacterium]|nr:DUF58 domain-containing protein [Lewinellaceae bacterium]
MDTIELLRKVRKIEVRTRGLSNHIFSGEYHSAFKGRGMSFSEVRDYSYGDDIRNIDWNVTARTGSPHIKIFEEERELTVMLLIDVSGSSFYGTGTAFKSELIAEISAVIAFSALTNHDKVGAILFSDKIEKYLPPSKGKQNLLRIIREILNITPSSKKTNIETGLKFFNNVEKKRSIAFVFSDFMDTGYQQALSIASKKHDIIGVRVYDESEKGLKDIGLVAVKDAESDRTILLDTSTSAYRSAAQKAFQKITQDFTQNFMSSKADSIHIDTEMDYIVELQKFFKTRALRR